MAPYALGLKMSTIKHKLENILKYSKFQCKPSHAQEARHNNETLEMKELTQ